MDKLPVFGTIARAYGFTFGNLATIIGLTWLSLPLLLLVGAAYGAVKTPAKTEPKEPEPGLAQATAAS
jgi:hypothetical protein